VSELYRRILDFTRDGVYRYTFDDGRVLFANAGLVEILGLRCDPSELLGRSLRDLLVYTEKEGSVREQLEQNGEIHGFEYHFQTLAGEDRWVIHDSFMTREGDGTRIVEAIVKDITYRKMAEQALAREKERLAVTLRSIGDAVIATDRSGLIAEMNVVAEQLTGWRREEALGHPLTAVFRIINETSREPCENPAQKVLESGTVVGLANHTMLIARDGTERVIADSGAPIHDREGQVIGVVLVFRDITEQRRMQERLARTERLAVLGKLAGGVGHDLRNPLAAIKNAAYFLRMAVEDPADEVQATLKILDDEVDNSERIIAGLLDFARPGLPEWTRVDLNELIRETVARRELPEGIAVCVELAEDVPRLVADETQLRRVLVNLLTNALQAMPEGGTLTVRSAHPAPDAVELVVSDTGVGIADEHRRAVFEPLFTTKAKGIGLGLAVVRSAVDLHRGTIEIDSTEGQGSTFRIRLPVRTGESE
jgi:PAS domain S-box-containing protein